MLDSIPKFPVPDWIKNAEFTYAISGEDIKEEAKRLGLLLPTFARSVGTDPKVIERYHKAGVRCMAYNSFSIRTLDPDESPRRGLCLGLTPELAIYDERSIRKRCIFADSTDGRRIEICPNNQNCIEALLEEVRVYMEAGLDGIFLDHAFGVSKCFGEDFGTHEHIYHEDDIESLPERDYKFVPNKETPSDDPVGNFAYAMLLSNAQQVMREYGEEKALNLNTTFWPFYYSASPIKKFVMYAPPEVRIVPNLWWENAESVMVESHVVVTERHIAKDTNDNAGKRWGRFEDWLAIDKTPQPYDRQGKMTLALPYFGANDSREDIFWCYAIAKLQNLIWETSPKSPGAIFCTFRLGSPVADDYEQQNGIYYRVYENGVAAVNSAPKESSLEIEVGSGEVFDLFAEQKMAAPGQKLAVKLPPAGGRVYLY